MKNNDKPHFTGRRKAKSRATTVPAHGHASIARVHKSLRTWQRLKTEYTNEELRAMTADQKIQHNRDSLCNALMQVAIETGRGQPPKVERLRAAANMVDKLVSNGVPFRVGRNSRMNMEIRVRLHEEALRSADNRRSRRNLISADAARDMLRQIRWLRQSSDHFTKMFPYTE
jgi:hypothetical protein